MTRTPLRMFVLALAAVLAALVVPGTAQAAPYCGITWGSLPKQAGNHRAAPSRARNSPPSGPASTPATTGSCSTSPAAPASAPGAWSTSRPSASDGSGAVVPLRGGAFLQINLGVNNNVSPPANSGDVANVTGFRTFRQVAGAGGFEGYTSEGLGVRARLPFRVFTLSGPGNTVRVVIDVAHAW